MRQSVEEGHPDLGSPGRGDRYHRLPDPAHGQGQPDNSRYAYEIATVGSNAPTCVHGASDGIGPESPNGFHFTYYVAAITADGEGFPAKVGVSP